MSECQPPSFCHQALFCRVLFLVYALKTARTIKYEWVEAVMHYSCALAVRMGKWCGCGCIPFHASQPGVPKKLHTSIMFPPAKVAATETDRVCLAMASGFSPW